MQCNCVCTGKNLRYLYGRNRALSALDKVVTIPSALWEPSAPVRSAGISFSLCSQHWRHQDYLTEMTPLLGTLLSINPSRVALFYSRYCHARIIHQLLVLCVDVGWDLLSDAAPEAAPLPYLAALQGEAVLTPPQTRPPPRWGHTPGLLWVSPGKLPNCTVWMQSGKICLCDALVQLEWFSCYFKQTFLWM